MIIAFTGPAQSGKDTAAEAVSLPIVKFADPLYELTAFMQEFVGFPIEKDRNLLIYVGTEWGRKHDPDIWVKLFKKRKFPEHCCVTDLRFKNEYQALRDAGAFIFYLDRPWFDRLKSEAKRRKIHWLRAIPGFIKMSMHPSERNMRWLKKRADVVINSGGSFEEYSIYLAQNVKSYIAALLSSKTSKF